MKKPAALNYLAILGLSTGLFCGCQSDSDTTKTDKQEEQAALRIQEQQTNTSESLSDSSSAMPPALDYDESTASTTWTTSWNTPTSSE